MAWIRPQPNGKYLVQWREPGGQKRSRAVLTLEDAEALGLAEFADYTRERLALLDELAYEASLFQLRWVLAGERARS